MTQHQLNPYQLSEGRYNARDVLATCRIYQPLLNAVKQHNVVTVYQVDKQLARLALQMKRWGMPIDQQERQRVGDTLRGIRDAAIESLRQYTLNTTFPDWVCEFQAVTVRKGDIERLAEVEAATGTTESAESAFALRKKWRREEWDKEAAKLALKGLSIINLNSKVQQAAILKVAGVGLVKVSAKTGVPTISKEVLEQFPTNPAAQAMLKYQITASVIETFVENLDVSAVDGCIHPDWPIHKITGRWGSEPNVQNWSVRAGGGAENLRRMVAAPNGWQLVGADFAQLEARILACLSRDPLLLAIFADETRDIHAEMSLVGFPQLWPLLNQVWLAHGNGTQCKYGETNGICSTCKRRKKLRDLVKRLEYGGFYGGDPATLWASVVKDEPGLMLRDVELFVKAINTKMPALIKWRQQVLRETIATKEVRSPFLGRRQTFPLGRVDPGVAFNYKAQSGGADLWALGALDFMKKWPQDGSQSDVKLIHNGHDSVLVLCRAELVDKVKHDVVFSWQRTIAGVTFKIEASIGHRWSEV